ncbi:MAG: hypothetical protein ABIZ81_07180 [Opitutaceae bacterium]
MSLLLACTFLIFAAGICILILGLINAPTGHEDQNGFHAMRPIRIQRPTPLVRPAQLPELVSHA